MNVFLVGGAVRDQLLNYPVTEKDYVVVGATPEAMIKQGFRPVGKDFPVFIHPQTGEEYALARTERKTAPGYKGFSFHADTSVTLEEDLQRRDLTINAMAQTESGQIIDPYKGQQDLENKLLRHVSSAFTEDPVRILRVARFAARYHHLGFTVADETMALMQATVKSGETQHLVNERVWQECVRALAERNPAIFFQTLNDCGALTDIAPELKTQLHTALSNLSTTAKHTLETEQRFAGLCFNLTQPAIKSFCERLAAPNRYKILARQTRKQATIIQQAQHNTPEAMITTLHDMDILRKPEVFNKSLEVIAWLQTGLAPDKLIKFWQQAASYYCKADAQALIKKGYTGAELGHALQRYRIELIASFLENL